MDDAYGLLDIGVSQPSLAAEEHIVCMHVACSNRFVLVPARDSQSEAVAYCAGRAQGSWVI